jgi:hypothetical protein
MEWLGRWLLRHAGHEFAAINDRLREIESILAEDRMTILETADLVSYRLSERERHRKRARVADPAGSEGDSPDRSLGALRRFGKV